MNVSLQVMSTGIKPKKAPVGFPVARRSRHAKEGDNNLLGMGECGVCGDNCGDCTYCENAPLLANPDDY